MTIVADADMIEIVMNAAINVDMIVIVTNAVVSVDMIVIAINAEIGKIFWTSVFLQSTRFFVYSKEAYSVEKYYIFYNNIY